MISLLKKRIFQPRLLLLILVTALSFSCLANDMYRSPKQGDYGTYYVLKSENIRHGVFKVLTSRIGKGKAYTDFTELGINCLDRKYFILAGSSEDGSKDKPSKPLSDWSKTSKWTHLVYGSSKYDLLSFVCNKH